MMSIKSYEVLSERTKEMTTKFHNDVHKWILPSTFRLSKLPELVQKLKDFDHALYTCVESAAREEDVDYDDKIKTIRDCLENNQSLHKQLNTLLAHWDSDVVKYQKAKTAAELKNAPIKRMLADDYQDTDVQKHVPSNLPHKDGGIDTWELIDKKEGTEMWQVI